MVGPLASLWTGAEPGQVGAAPAFDVVELGQGGVDVAAAQLQFGAAYVDLFEQEFPDFQPFPWGARRWIHGHVRHVMLAEAMLGDFAAAFEGVTPDEAERLADSFGLGQCQIRKPLADLLRRAATGDRARPEIGG